MVTWKPSPPPSDTGRGKLGQPGRDRTTVEEMSTVVPTTKTPASTRATLPWPGRPEPGGEQSREGCREPLRLPRFLSARSWAGLGFMRPERGGENG